MISKIELLDRVEIAAPCSADWEQMQGDDRKRFCDQCRLNVYNISDMSRGDAEALIRKGEQSGERLCLRLYRRADGTILTDNCPVGLRRLRNLAVRRWAIAASVLGSLLHLPGSAKADKCETAGKRLDKAGRVDEGYTAGVPRLAPPPLMGKVVYQPAHPVEIKHPVKPAAIAHPVRPVVSVPAPAPVQTPRARHTGLFWFLVRLYNSLMGGKS